MKKSKAEVIVFRRQKSDEVWAEAMSMVRDKHWAGAANRLYYSAFHTLSALLLSEDILIKSHSGAKAMFELNFIKTGRVEKGWVSFMLIWPMIAMQVIMEHLLSSKKKR